ncbi:MAG: PIN domain-containing protein [Flavobacteriales bacterium]|nr:PIN domain-containing protein [Flavobacteriales bacterium]
MARCRGAYLVHYRDRVAKQARLTRSGIGKYSCSFGQLLHKRCRSGIKTVAAKLGREHGLKLADAIIAATALHLDIPLLMADSGFDRLDKLVKVRRL